MAIEKLPVPEEEKNNKLLYTRRQMGEIASASLTLGVAGGIMIEKGLQNFLGEKKGEENVPEEERMERNEDSYEASELFLRERSGYKKLYKDLKRNEILFINEDGAPLGEPVQLEPIEGVLPGSFDKRGFLTGEMNQVWLDRQREKICAELEIPCDLPKSIPRQMNVISQLRGIASSIPQNELDPETYLDVVHYFARKKVIGAEDKTRLEFIREHVGENLNISANAQKELTLLIPGLAAQESQFNNSSESSVGAKGVFQFMPDTWREFGYQPEEIRFLTKQIEAAGKYFSRAYNFIGKHAELALKVAEREYFNGSKEDFERHFLVPVLLNSYNSGPGRLVAVLKWFTDHYPNREDLEKLIGSHPEGFGKDVYQAMTHQTRGKVPGYGRDSSQYVARLSALAELLKEK